MNDHMWKKCGEVKAFAAVNKAFLKRGKPALKNTVFSADEIEELVAANRTHRDQLDTIAETAEEIDLVNNKAEKTVTKLQTLQDTYLEDDDDWEDAVELLEWSGFFHGGALVHWNLVAGAAQASSNQKLAKLASGGYKFHHEVLHAVKDGLEERGVVSM